MPLSDQLVGPIDVRAGLDRIDGGDCSSPFSDREADSRSHSLQMPAEVRLQFADSNAFHT